MNLKTANAQSGHFSYKIEVQGIQKWYNSNCGTVLENYSSPINRTSTTELFHEFVLGMADGYTYRLARTSVDANVKFYIYWHSEAEPPDKVFVAIRHHEGGSLQVQCSPQIGSARANFRGYLHENISVAVSGGCGNQFACGNTVNFGEEDVHVYELPKSAFRRIDSNLCEAILVIPYSLSAMGEGYCPPPGHISGMGRAQYFARSQVQLDPEAKFVIVEANNEPSYSKKDDCVYILNNTTGRLDEREGDTAVELIPIYRSVYTGGYGAARLTDWYLGSKITYYRRLFGNWCPNDCPLNEWTVCGAYYKDNLFHEFTLVNAIVGLPRGDCEIWYLGTEEGFLDAPSDKFWEREDVRERYRAIFDQLPYEYEVVLKVTDNYGNDPAPDTAKYRMRVHAQMENYRFLRTYRAYLPENVEGRTRPDTFIPSPSAGAHIVYQSPANLTMDDVSHTVRGVQTVSEERKTKFGWQCNARGEGSLGLSEEANPIKLLLELQFGYKSTVYSTNVTIQEESATYTIPRGYKLVIYAQSAAYIEEGVWDVYDFHGYRGTVATKNQSRTYGFVRYAVIEPVGER